MRPPIKAIERMSLVPKNFEENLENRKNGAEFLHVFDPNLHHSKAVEGICKQYRQLYHSIVQDPANKLQVWLNHVKDTYLNESGKADGKSMQTIKNHYVEKYLSNPEDIAMALQKYHATGLSSLDSVGMANDVKGILNEQAESLNKWIEYLLSDEMEKYPLWARYWVIRNVLSLGKFNPVKKRYYRRRKNTLASFPDLNKIALDKVLEKLVFSVEDSDSEKNDVKKPAIHELSFNQLYCQEIENLIPRNVEEEVLNKGYWVIYEKGLNNNLLLDDLECKNTEWCIAKPDKSYEYLAQGDLHIYYTPSLAENDNFAMPRACVRVIDEKVVEVKGVGDKQDIESKLLSSGILEEKLAEFNNADAYNQKVNDQKKLDIIYKKALHDQELSIAELRFLYEVDKPIGCFVGPADPRVANIIQDRNIEKDLLKALQCRRDEISLGQENPITGNIKFRLGHIKKPYITAAEELILPEVVHGDIEFYLLSSAGTLISPKIVYGKYDLRALKRFWKIELPELVRGAFNMNSVVKLKGTKFPKSVDESVSLMSLEEAVDCEFSEYIGGDFEAHGLDYIKNCKMPNHIGGSMRMLNIPELEDCEFGDFIGGTFAAGKVRKCKNVKFPKLIMGSFSMGELESIDDTELSSVVFGNVSLPSLRSSENGHLPDEIGGHAELSGLTEIKKGFLSKNKIGMQLNIRNVKNVDDLDLPKELGGININAVKQIRRLKFPESMSGSIEMENVESIGEISFPISMGGNIKMPSIRFLANMVFPGMMGDLLLDSAETLENVILPIMMRDLKLSSLKSAKGVIWPEYLRNLDIRGLEDLEGLNLNSDISGEVTINPMLEAEFKAKFPRIHVAEKH